MATNAAYVAFGHMDYALALELIILKYIFHQKKNRHYYPSFGLKMMVEPELPGVAHLGYISNPSTQRCRLQIQSRISCCL